jgi:hypothetical protein
MALHWHTSADARALEGTTEHFVKQLQQRASASEHVESWWLPAIHTQASNGDGDALDELVVSAADEVRARRLEQQCRFVPLRLTDDERALAEAARWRAQGERVHRQGRCDDVVWRRRRLLWQQLLDDGRLWQRVEEDRRDARRAAQCRLAAARHGGRARLQAWQDSSSKHSIEANAEFFQTIFEIGRRFKIMNPDKMRTTYGKLMHILQDAVTPGMLEFDVVAPIKTVHSLLLKRRGAFALLADPDLPRAIAALNDAGVTADEHQSAVAAKRAARQRLIERHTVSTSQLSSKVPIKKAKKNSDDEPVETAPAAPEAVTGGGGGGGVFSSITRPIMNLWSGSGGGSGGNKRDDSISNVSDDELPALTPDELILVLESLADSESHLLSCHAPVADVLSWLERLFDPSTSEDETDLAIKYGSSGCKLTHSHPQQFQFVRQSLMLWCEVQKQMFRLWLAADADMLSPQGYRLVNTGQGLNRVQPAPCVSSAMSDILGIVKGQVGRSWVGLSVVHLGDRDVPNALFFIDKYTQVPRILAPISRTVHAVDRLARNERTWHFVQFFLTPEQIAAGDEGRDVAVLQTRRRILRSFFRLGFNGDGDDGGSCIDGRLTSAWNWCSQVEGKIFFSIFQLAGFGGFDGSFQQ